MRRMQRLLLPVLLALVLLLSACSVDPAGPAGAEMAEPALTEAAETAGIIPENNAERKDEEERKEYLKNIKEMTNVKFQMPAQNPMDDGYKRLQYVRYADDWLCGVIGSKQDAEQIKSDIKE